MLKTIKLIAANGQGDAQRFIALGANPEQIVVTGNVKFDLTIPAELTEEGKALRIVLGKERFVWIAASTHEGEEEMVLRAHKKIRAQNPLALLILVPRHPDRFETVAQLCKQDFVTVRRSQMVLSVTPETGVFLGDTMGELLLMYSAADVAFIAGSLVPRGGHNLLEPAVLKKPLLTGPHVFNFQEISELLLHAHALTKISDTDSLAQAVLNFMHHPDLCMESGENAFQVMQANRGALAKQVELVKSNIVLA